ncbi:hypothetical protein [Paraglaciecola sp.]|uniref:hypothetical protein n=1 Tax=Paraglaciecola sp. TaxID=1920173 RepID=UPI0032668F7D
MEFFNPIQLIILVLIIALLITQKIAINKGLLVQAYYSSNQRLSIAISVAAIPCIFAVLVNQYLIVVFGIAMGIVCYQRKSWYKFKWQ